MTQLQWQMQWIRWDSTFISVLPSMAELDEKCKKFIRSVMPGGSVLVFLAGHGEVVSHGPLRSRCSQSPPAPTSYAG